MLIQSKLELSHDFTLDADLDVRFKSWKTKIQDIPPSRIYIYIDSPKEFLALICACWACKHLPIALPSEQSINLIQNDVGFLISDNRVQKLIDDTNHIANPFPKEIVFLTSGSTGQPKYIHKDWESIRKEIQVLHTDLAIHVHDTHLITTVSHQHIYGFLFTIAWPALSNRAIAEKRVFFLEEIQRDFEIHQKILLITSPSHGRYFSDFLAQNKTNCLRIFSSGGAIPEDIAKSVAKYCDKFIEVYGSTETGGIAFRQWTQDGAQPWLPMCDVQWQISGGELLVQSSRTISTQEWIEIGDKAEPFDNGFRLLGRSDRIVKISEKRVSLTALENELMHTQLVLDVRCFSSFEQSRHQLNALLILSNEGEKLYKEIGRIGLKKHFRQHLSQNFEGIAIPKDWAFAKQIPINPQGKQSTSDMVAFFKAYNFDGIQAFLIQKDIDAWIFEITIPPTYPRFQGHFPNFPVLAGVCQLLWVQIAIRHSFDTSFTIRNIGTLKFQTLLKPGVTIYLKSTRHPKYGYTFSIQSADETQLLFSKGRIS